MNQENSEDNETVYYSDVEDGTADESNDGSKVYLRKKFLVGLAAFFGVAISVVIVSVILINVFNVNYIKVSGNSMQPTFSTNDGVFISTTDDDPQRNDITVFVTPPSWLEYTGNMITEPTFFVKRAIGVGGDAVEFSEQGVSVNGASVFSNDAGLIPCQRNAVSGVLDQDQYLLLGDNNNFSTDAYRLYCTGAEFDEVIVDREMIHYFGDEVLTIDGGWGWFESYSGTGQDQ